MSATQQRPDLVELLPAVYREDEVGFARKFLAAFEEVSRTVEAELAVLPELAGGAPPPTFAYRARRGAWELLVESAVGIHADDVVQLDDALGRYGTPASTKPARAPAVEFVTVADVGGAPAPAWLRSALPKLTPSRLTLAQPLARARPRGTPVLTLGRPVATTALSEHVEALNAPPLVHVAGAAALLEPGDVLRVGEEPDVDHLQVVTVDGEAVTVAPAPAHGHEIATPVTVLRRPVASMPDADYRWAERSGSDLVVAAAARGVAGKPGRSEQVLELDSVAGLSCGDVLRIREDDADRVELVRIRLLPPRRPLLRRPNRFAVRLERPLEHDHAAGVPVDVIGPERGPAAALLAEAAAGDTTVEVDDATTLGAAAGDVLDVDGELRHVAAATDATLALRPPLAARHRSGAPVRRALPAGGGTGFVAWLGAWLGVAVRPDRGERWNRELLRRAGTLWPWRGTRRGVEAILNAWLRGEASAVVLDASNPLQIGLHSTIGVDSVICGRPSAFTVELTTNPRNTRTYQPAGLVRLVEAAHEALGRERPAHTVYEIRLHARTMQLGGDPSLSVGARLGDTTLLWDEPLVLSDDERSDGWPTRT